MSNDREILVSALHKNGQIWVVLCEVATVGQALEQLGRWAANCELAFNWRDAALLAHSLQNNARKPPGAGDQI